MLRLFKQPEKYSDTSVVKSPATPAERARAAYDERIGSVVVQNYNWRRIAIGLLIVCFMLGGGLTTLALTSRVVPYVVTVDKTTGEVQQAGALIAQNYTPQEAEIRYFLAQFIQNARNIQLDPVQQERMQNQALAFLTQSAAQKYHTIQRNEHFRERYAKVTAQTKINSMEKIPDTDSYHVTWIEEEFDIATGAQRQRSYQGVFTITVIEQRDEARLLVNPLGLYISDLSFSEEMNKKSQTAGGK